MSDLSRFISKAAYYEGDVYEVNGIDITTKEYQKVSTTQEDDIGGTPLSKFYGL